MKAQSEEMILLSWNTQQLGRKVDLLLNNRISVENLDVGADTKDRFATTYSKFGSKSSV